ncbi:acetyl esterase [Noviherbaspirillum suwonense]|jgi:acetyl esterase|uniref:Acetyl esterase n=2 Tax=Noviherbaspirillum suwonense TaxID=1224511 RepID=A0ABY1Q8T2_9BURK|nr:acetyl esterase [Noviherbaspirillum suwonense]
MRTRGPPAVAPFIHRYTKQKKPTMKKTPLILSAVALTFAAGLTHAQSAQQPPKADPAMQKVLDALASLGGKPIETLTPEEARKQPTPADAVKKVLQDMGKSTEPEAGVTVRDMTVPGPIGDIPVHVYTPEGKGPFPVMVYYHGGGFVIADTQTYDASPRALAKMAKAIMVAVDYHQAPENKFPAAANDAYAAYTWVVHHAKEINGDPKRIAVGGESAGGNLATVVSMMARDKKEPLPVHQLLVYPVVNNDMNTPSYQRNEQAKPLNKPMMQWFFKHYSAKEEDGSNPYAVPMKAATLKGLPSATIIAAEIDPLLSEGKAYADRLKKDGVKVTYKEYKGVAHEFFGMGAVVPKAKEAEKLAADQLKAAFSAKGM